MRQLTTATADQRTVAGWLGDVSTALMAYTRAFEYWVKQNAQVASAAETVRLAFTLRKDGSTGYLQVLTNDAMLHREQVALISAQQKKSLALTTLYSVLRGGS